MYRTRLAALALVALCLLPAPAEANELLNYERRTLDNGLDLVLHVDRKLPLIAVNLSYHVGTMHDGATPGLAHLVEHLMFRGTTQLDDGALPARYQEAGALFNATTSQDRTAYYALMPATNLPTALWLEANRMTHMLPVLDDTKVNEEIATTSTEWRSKIEGARFGLSRVAVWDAVFPAGHPLYDERPETIQKLRKSDVEAFVSRYYGPQNATLVLAGDLPEQVHDWVDFYFGERSGGERAVTPSFAAVAPEGEQRIVRRAELSTTPMVTLAWLTPALFNPGDADADIFATLLGKELEATTQALAPGLLLNVDARQFSFSTASAFMVSAEGSPEAGPQQMLETLEAALDQARKTMLTDAEVVRARKQLSIGTLRSLQGLEARADRMQLYIAAGKSPDWLDEDLARYESLSANSVGSFVDTYLTTERRVVVLTYPAEAKP